MDNKKVMQVLNPNKVWIPVFIGLGIVFYLFYSDDSLTPSKLGLIFDAKLSSLSVALLLLLARDAGYVYRIHVLTDHKINWVRCIGVIILWEFSSAVTPSVVGGTAVAIFILTVEGIKFGKSVAYVMLTAILDNLFFVISAPLVMLFTQGEVFPATTDPEIKEGLQYVFTISYSVIALYSLVMSYALFIKPLAFKSFLLKMTSFELTKKWREKANRWGNDILESSREFKGKLASYWVKIISVTIFIWTARYLMLNSIISAYSDISFTDQMVIFSRQIIMWIVMLLSPTPGSTGTAEFAFGPFFDEYLGDYTLVTSILWRLMTYYPYLLLGALFLPRWIKNNFFDKKLEA